MRELERLLWQYEQNRIATIHHSTSVGLGAALRQVCRAVTVMAGRRQAEEERQCGWCGKWHHDPHPDLCRECA